jgi:hypothetical protein
MSGQNFSYGRGLLRRALYAIRDYEIDQPVQKWRASFETDARAEFRLPKTERQLSEALISPQKE